MDKKTKTKIAYGRVSCSQLTGIVLSLVSCAGAKYTLCNIQNKSILSVCPVIRHHGQSFE